MSLPESKRSKSKSKSPPSREGVKAMVAQAGASEECLIRDPPHRNYQVSTMIVFGSLFEAFSYLDSIKRTQEVCTQEKKSTSTTSPMMTKRVPKLKCFVPFRL